MAEKTDFVRADCGCEMWTVGEAFYFRPCKPDCELWQYARAEADRQEKPMQYRMDLDG